MVQSTAGPASSASHWMRKARRGTLGLRPATERGEPRQAREDRSEEGGPGQELAGIHEPGFVLSASAWYLDGHLTSSSSAWKRPSW